MVHLDEAAFSNTLVSMIQSHICKRPLAVHTFNVYFFSVTISASLVADAEKQVTYSKSFYFWNLPLYSIGKNWTIVFTSAGLPPLETPTPAAVSLIQEEAQEASPHLLAILPVKLLIYFSLFYFIFKYK